MHLSDSLTPLCIVFLLPSALLFENFILLVRINIKGIRSLNQECVYGSSRRKRHEEYQSMVKDKVEEAELKYSDANEHWHQMKNIMMDTAKVTCGLSKGPCRHKETWWWNEEVAEAVREEKVRKLEKR